jgi:Zn finger protein HypA/HybF involved in hydrogenase expression
MHELSLAQEICRLAEAHLAPDQCPRLLTVGVAVGCEAGIEPDSLEFCLSVLLQQAPFGRARPVLERVPGTDLHLRYLEVDDGDPDH